MYWKLVESRFNPETHISYALIDTSIGAFSGWCTTHEEDYDIESEFTGIEIAEKKAYVKMLKAYRKQLNMEIKLLEDLCKRFACYKDYNYDSFEARQFRKVLYEKRQKRDDYTNIIEAYKTNIAGYAEKKRVQIEKLQRYQEKRNKTLDKRG